MDILKNLKTIDITGYLKHHATFQQIIHFLLKITTWPTKLLLLQVQRELRTDLEEFIHYKILVFLLQVMQLR